MGELAQQKTVEELEDRVTKLEWLVGVIAGQIAEPANKSRPVNDPGGTRIVRPLNRKEIQEDVSKLLARFGLDDSSFRVL